MLLVVGGIFSFSQTVQAENANEWPVAINETNFPDEEFRNYLLEQDFGIDESLSEAEMKNVTNIGVDGNKKITSLVGIEYFQNLQILSCHYTRIESLDVSKNTNLVNLSCGSTEIRSLDVSKNTNLEYLSCDSTGISELDVSNNANLIELYCFDTGIDILDVSKNINLVELSCGSTGISSLDVGENTNLVELSCCATGISELDVSKNTNLVDLSCYETEISELDVSKNINLVKLSCNDTRISSLDVSNHTNLEQLSCGLTGISSLDVSMNINLEYLSCGETKISSLDVSKNTKLVELYCHDTKISSLDVSNTNLTYVDCANCVTPVLLSSGNIINLSQLSCLDVTMISDLQNATLTNNKLIVNDPSEKVSYAYDCGKGISETFNLEISSYEINYDANGGAGQMDKAAAEEGKAFTLPKSRFAALSGMRFKEWSIGSKDGVKVSAGKTYTFSQPTTVYAVWEKIPEIEWPIAIDETNFPDEEFRNYLREEFQIDKSLSKAEMEKVTEIGVSGNKNITSLEGIDYFQNLETLSCDDTGISELDISQNLNLVDLSCSNTGISSLVINNNTKLESLRCCDTGINILNISKNINLKELWCSNTGINSLDVSNHPNLEVLHCYQTKINSLDLSNNTKLKELWCGNTRINSLDVSNTSLIDLSCANCITPVMLKSENIIDLSQLSGLDASKISNLQNATLADNKLTVKDPSEIVSYTYDCGKGMSETFNLEISSYEINYDANGGTGQMEPGMIIKGELFTLPLNEFTAPSGMQFIEWSIGSIDGDKVKAGKTYIFNEAITAYAVWEKIPEIYTITYDANGGAGQMDEATAIEGKAFTLSKNRFKAPSGMRFKEWSIGSKEGDKVRAGKTYTFNQTTTVYAVWEKNPEIVWPVAIDETNFPDDEFRNYLIEYLREEFEIDESLSEADMENVTNIDVSGKENIISLYGIEYFQNLRSLSCEGTGISELDVTHNPNLENLECNNTEISSLDVSKNTNLKNLRCDETQISELDVSQNPNLKSLYCNETGISRLDVSKNTYLENLECCSTGISSLDVSQNLNLVQLWCSNTEINILDISKNTNLHELSCGSTRISVLDISENTNLTGLGCSNTEISSLDVSKHPNLESLYCFETKISSLDVSNNPNLVDLWCNDTRISSLDVSNTSLKQLNCYNCVAPVLLTSGNIIDLSQLPGLDASKISNLKNATLADNKLTVKNPLEMVSYTYDCGKRMSVDFNLEASSYEISYDANEGTGQMETRTVTAGDIFTLPQNNFTAPNGMQFKEWAIGSKDGDKVKPGKTYTFTGATTVYAVWEPIPVPVATYIITYDSNGGAGQMAKATVTEGKAFILPQNSFTAPSGMQFKEWAIGSTSGAKVKPGSTYIFTGATTIYAIWEPIPVTVTTYAITYDANGGTGQMAQATATKEKAFTLPQNSFTAPSGMQFKEWAIGSTGGAKVKAGGTYTFTGATTVYAIWEKIPETVKEVKKASFEDLQLKAKASKTSNKLSWKRVKGADGYVVYGAKRGKKLTEIKASTKGISFTHKKLSKKTFYQYQVKAYCLVNGEKKFISVSQIIYSVTTGGKYDNPKKLTVNASKLTLKKGKTKTIKAKLVGTNGKKLKNYTKAFRYETSNSKIATVSAKGKIKARKKGKCIVYVYTQNGLSKSIRVTVK